MAIIVTAGLYVALPARYRVQPAWVVPVASLLAVLIAGNPGRIELKTNTELTREIDRLTIERHTRLLDKAAR